jgi:hypothetical protein
MTTDDTGQGDLSGLPVPQNGVQPEDALPGQPQADRAELDAYGVPVQDRPAKTVRTYLLVAAALACSIGGIGLGVVEVNQADAHKPVNEYLGGLGFVLSLLALCLGGLGTFASEQRNAGQRKFLQEKLGLARPGRVGSAICAVAAVLGVIGMCAPLVVSCPNCSP